MDFAETAFRVMEVATGSLKAEKAESVPKKKNQAAVDLGRLGGLVGGKARAKSLSKEERVEIARKAAQKRWDAVKENKGK